MMVIIYERKMIMDYMPILKDVCLALTILLAVCYAYQIVYMLVPLIKKRKKLPQASQKKYAILIAARNEEAVLPYLLDSIAHQDYPKELVTTYVVADNCTDGTAQAARAHGARVFERFNRVKIGKGYALNYLLGRIREEAGWDAYDAFLIFDADNLLQPNYITEINKVRGAGFEAFCGYRNTKNFGTNWLSSGYGVWYLHDSTHMNQSRMMLGTSCAVSGTGFGFTSQLLEKMGGWKFFTLTEDLEFNTWCVTHGIKIGYSQDAVIYDEQPFDFRQSWRQRTRWTQGGVQIVGRYTGALARGLFQGGWASYATFETSTLTMWGCALSTFTGILTALTAYLARGWGGLGFMLLVSLVGGYLSAMVMGALTVAMEWKHIAASRKMKILSVFAFPVFMLTFIPISLTAVFRKFQWQPTAHTVAISSKALSENS